MDGDPDEAVQWHLGDHMIHSYYLDTVTNIRSATKCICDMVMIVLIMCFIMNGLNVLREKNRIDNYHERWVLDEDENLGDFIK